MTQTREHDVIAEALVIIDRGLLWGQLCAVATITLIPVVLVSIFIQRYIVSGLTLGAIKE